MTSRRVTILNKSGLHARPAVRFVNAADEFESRVYIRRAGTEGEGVDAKSIMALLALGLKQGEEAEIMAWGTDEEEAVARLAELIQGGLDEK